MGETIYKILRAKEWQHASANTAYAGSADDLRDGFVHFSTGEQLQGTLEKYYRGEKQVCIAAFETQQFSGDTLRWEPSRGGDLFPHLYAPLNVQLAVAINFAEIPNSGPLVFSLAKEASL